MQHAQTEMHWRLKALSLYQPRASFLAACRAFLRKREAVDQRMLDHCSSSFHAAATAHDNSLFAPPLTPLKPTVTCRLVCLPCSLLRQGLGNRTPPRPQSPPQTHDEACPLGILLRDLLGLNRVGVLPAEGELSDGHIVQVDVKVGSPLCQNPADVPADNLQGAPVQDCACSTAGRLAPPPAGVNAGTAPGITPVLWVMRRGSWETQHLAVMHELAASSMA